MILKERELTELQNELKRLYKLIAELKRRKKPETQLRIMSRQTEYETAKKNEDFGEETKPELYYHWQNMEKGAEIIKNELGFYSIHISNFIPRYKLNKSKSEKRYNTLKECKYGDYMTIRAAKEEFKKMTLYEIETWYLYISFEIIIILN